MTKTLADAELLDGSKHNYTLTFAADQFPPVNAFWSVTMYNGKTQLLLDLAFETLGPLTEVPYGIFYGDLKRDPLWEPLRQDPRYDKLLAELAPQDSE